MMQSQGVDTLSDYEPMQQAHDCITQPMSRQKAKAPLAAEQRSKQLCHSADYFQTLNSTSSSSGFEFAR
jgi:hypothetical protein